MTRRLQLVLAAALALVEYLLFSYRFDARELVPTGFVELGAVAPIPVIAGVAFLILRSSARGEAVDEGGAEPAATSGARRPRGLAVALLALHALSVVALVAVSSELALRRAAGQGATALEAAWAALAATTAITLLAFALVGGALATARRVAGPLALAGVVGVAAWAAGRGTGELWRPLSRATMIPVAAVVRALSPDAVVDLDALVIGTERFNVDIAPVCSGYEGMGLVAVLLGSFVWSFRSSLRFPHALAVPLLGVALAFLANAARITALIYVGTLGAPEAAFGGFHSKAGWLLFCAVALGTVALARRWRALQREGATAAADGSSDNPTLPYLVPLLAMVAGRLVAGLAFDGELDHLELVPVTAALVALALLRRQLRGALPDEAPLLTRPALVAVGAGAAVALLWLALTSGDRADDEPVRAQLVAWAPAAALGWVALRIVASVVLAPLVEELAFRGFLLRRLAALEFSALAYRGATPLAFVVSSVVFGALHEHLAAGFAAGLVYAATAWATGRLRDAVLAHAVTNAILAVVVVGGDRWSLWV